MKPKKPTKAAKLPVRYAVVGLGHIAQVAVLPGFKHAKNSKLVALISGSPEKLKKVARKYKVSRCYNYEQYDECLKSGEIDAVYIALPNTMHRSFAERAVRSGIHVLCEKPLALTSDDCESMIRLAEENRVKLMTAYRLHFDRANLAAIELVQSGKLGDLRIFTSTFTQQVPDPENIRLRADVGGGTLYDIGIYCINAARNLFRAEPLEVSAMKANNGQARFREVEEMTSCILRFPNDRLASFTASFGAKDESSFEVIGTKGRLRVTSSFSYVEPIEHELRIGKSVRRKSFKPHDQFGAELLYFSNCVRSARQPEPSGREGLADVRIIQALYASAEAKQTLDLAEFPKTKRPGLYQQIHRPKVKEPELVSVSSPSG